MKDGNKPIEYNDKDDEMLRKYIQLSDYQHGMAMGLLIAGTILKDLNVIKQPEKTA